MFPCPGLFVGIKFFIVSFSRFIFWNQFLIVSLFAGIESLWFRCLLESNLYSSFVQICLLQSSLYDFFVCWNQIFILSLSRFVCWNQVFMISLFAGIKSLWFLCPDLSAGIKSLCLFVQICLLQSSLYDFFVCWNQVFLVSLSRSVC